MGQLRIAAALGVLPAAAYGRLAGSVPGWSAKSWRDEAPGTAKKSPCPRCIAGVMHGDFLPWPSRCCGAWPDGLHFVWCGYAYQTERCRDDGANGTDQRQTRLGLTRVFGNDAFSTIVAVEQ